MKTPDGIGLPERLKVGINRDGERIILRRTPVTTSRSGRFVYEYHVLREATRKTIWRGMSRKYGYMYFNAETSR